MTGQRQLRNFVKRTIDLIGATVGLVVLSPVLVVLALLIRSKLGSPVIFQQQRPGRDGKIFTLYKFRSMLEVDPTRGIFIDDQRMTSFGRRLRALSLDELPTLINVVKGDMSLVGPRPLHVEYLSRYSTHQSRRHEVRPGVTGFAQVRGRNSLNWDERFDLDVQYVDEHSLWLDLKILVETVGRVFTSSDIEAEGASTMPIFTGVEPQDGLTEKLMSQRWHKLWRAWQQDDLAIKTGGAETTRTDAVRYWVYLNRDQQPVCIAGLTGLGGDHVTATLLLSPDHPDQSYVPAVMARLRLHGNFYQAQKLLLELKSHQQALYQVAHRAGFVPQQQEPATDHTTLSDTNVLKLTLAAEMRA